jgi:hypothetical protein
MRRALPLASLVTIVRDSRIGAAARAGQYEESGMTVDELGERGCAVLGRVEHESIQLSAVIVR